MKGRARGNHPLNSLAAVGPSARELIAGQAPLDVYAPFRELARLNGYVVMMGVDLRTMTALHLAEQMAGRTLFRRWASDYGGAVVEAECGGCSRGFNGIEPALRPVERRETVGNSLWRIFPIADALERASAAIRECPEITRCAVGGCEDGIEGGCFVRSATSGASPSQARTNSSTTVCLPSSRRPGSSGFARWCRTCLHSRL